MSEYYCEKHKYNPPENSGMAFCPQCEGLEVDLIDGKYYVEGIEIAPPPRNERITGKDLRVGDRIVWTMGGELREITRFDEHPGWKDGSKLLPARVLVSEVDGQHRAVTILDDDDYRATSDGAWIHLHCWFAYEQRRANR